MANRHLARSVVLQSLFEWDFEDSRDVKLEEAVLRNAEEFAPGVSDTNFMTNLAKGVAEKQKDIDTIIGKAAPEWPLDKISPVDRNILRLGLYELLFADRSQVPAKVAINEAVELAKTFGGETSGKFVNGVLGAVYKEMGEPGKDEVSTKKKKIPDIPYEKMPIERLGGAVVYATDTEGNIQMAFVHDIFGHWTLSKGHLEEGESDEDGVARAIKEEIGLDVTVKDELGRTEYIASHPEKGKLRKQVAYFLAEGTFQELDLKETGGLDNAQWFPLEEIPNLNFYDDIVPLLTKAVTIVKK